MSCVWTCHHRHFVDGQHSSWNVLEVGFISTWALVDIYGLKLTLVRQLHHLSDLLLLEIYDFP